MSKVFRKIRALTDQQLTVALSNHQRALQHVILWVDGHNRWQWGWRVWASILTAVVVYHDLTDTSVVDLLARLVP